MCESFKNPVIEWQNINNYIQMSNQWYLSKIGNFTLYFCFVWVLHILYNVDTRN